MANYSYNPISTNYSYNPNKYTYNPDQYTNINQVTHALREAGLESSNLILAVDFTKSNEWTGKYSFDGLSLHAILPNGMNPYEQAISIIGRTLSQFDEDNLIPCFGFGDATTHDQSYFNFNPEGRTCHGVEGVLKRYREILPYINLSGPTSYAPVIRGAIDTVKRNGNRFHVLVIIADGQVTGNVQGGMLSVQEKATIDAIVEASNYPLSIILVGVGDGPWDMMRYFDDAIPKRNFDNFQFVNFNEITSRCSNPAYKEAAFAVAALMELPKQYKAIQHLGLSQPRPISCPPPAPYASWKPQPQPLSNNIGYNRRPMAYY